MVYGLWFIYRKALVRYYRTVLQKDFIAMITNAVLVHFVMSDKAIRPPTFRYEGNEIAFQY